MGILHLFLSGGWMDGSKVKQSTKNAGDRNAPWLPLACMSLALSLVECILGHSRPPAGSLAISKISLILAIGLFVTFQRARKRSDRL